MIKGEREKQLIGALCAAFEIVDLRAVVEMVDRELAEHVNWNEAKRAVVADVLRAARCRGGDGLVEAVVRSARRARPDNTTLGAAVLSCWRYAGGLDARLVDELAAALAADGLSLDEVEKVAARVVRSFPALRVERAHEAIADLVERIAGHAAPPGAVLPLLQVAAGLAVPGRPELSAWLARACSTGATSGPVVPARSTRMLIVLYPEDNDDYSVAVFLSNAAGRPQLVAALTRSSLAGIPARIQEEFTSGTRLFEAIRTSEIDQIDVVLPLRNMLAAVDEWTLPGDELTIGENYRVVVRCLERNLADRYPTFVLARQKAVVMWREMHKTRDRRCVVHWIEAAAQLAPIELKQALRRHAVKEWLVAAVCADAPNADRQDALALMIRHGVPAAIALRGSAATPARPSLEPLCAQPFKLPTGIHEYRTRKTSFPVTLLWEDPDFLPEEWR